MTAAAPLVDSAAVLRPYQRSAVDAVREAWGALSRAGSPRWVCLVAPTGSGKTTMGSELARLSLDVGPVVWLAHRRELLDQAADRLRRDGAPWVGVVSPLHDREDDAPIQVASTQTLAARLASGQALPPAATLVLDECHHYQADEWRDVAAHYADARAVGLTATPQRRDGRPLGDTFRALVVAARYSDLRDAGHLVTCRVFRPDAPLGRDLAQDPVVALKRYAADRATFAFTGTVDGARALAERFTTAGVWARVVAGETRADERRDSLDEFTARAEAGVGAVLVNVYTLTEGVDVPAASCVLLARGVTHAGPYLQMVGRVLRPWSSGDRRKDAAVLIDLPGCSHVHGLPDADRHYSLDGRPIAVVGEQLRVCPSCGLAVPQSAPSCEGCGHVFEQIARRDPRIWDHALREVYAGADTPTSAKEREWYRLAALCRTRGWSLSWAVKEYGTLFRGEHPPWVVAVPDEIKREEYGRLVAFGRSRGYKPGFAAARYKSIFLAWPPRAGRG